MRHWLAVLSIAALAVSSAGPSRATDRASADSVGEVTVFAAASLTEAFTEIGRLYESRNAGAKVTLNFAGSQQLAAQILEAAPADVFASASDEQMKRVSDAGLVSGTPVTFVRNQMAIVVEPRNPKSITGLKDLSRADLVVVLAAEEVPAGRYAREALRKANVAVSPASLETDVRGVLSKVALGEADAGIVYRSDLVAAAGKVAGVEIPAEENVVASYPIAALDRAVHAEAAAAFIELVRSEEGRAILTKFGFGSP